MGHLADQPFHDSDVSVQKTSVHPGYVLVVRESHVTIAGWTDWMSAGISAVSSAV